MISNEATPESTYQAADQQTEEKVLGSSLLPRKVHFLIS